MHHHSLSVKAYQDFNNGEALNPILVQLCSVDDIPGVLSSPRSCKLDKSHYEFCLVCSDSLKPSKNDTTGPPKHAIANGFTINHLPIELKIEREDTPMQSNITNQDISDIMQAVLACQHPHTLIFAFIGDAHCSVMGQAKLLQNITK